MSILFNGNAFRLDIEGSVPVVVEMEEVESEDEDEVASEEEDEDEIEFKEEDEDEIESEEEDEDEIESEEEDEGGQGFSVLRVESEDKDHSRQLQPSQTIDAAESPSYILIQSKNSFTRDSFKVLRECGVHFIEYLSANAWLCRIESPDLSVIRHHTFIKAVETEYEHFKSEEQTVDVLLHDDNAEMVALQICQALNMNIDPKSIIRNSTTVRITVRGDQLEEIAKLNRVKAVEEVVKLELHNNVARKILGFDDPGVGVYDGKTISRADFEGEGQIVTVADTGFDTGDKNRHPAFKDRVLELIPVGKSDTKDHQGHGTHVCGSVLGSAWSKELGGLIQGTAPRAKLIVQALSGEMIEETAEFPLFGDSKKTLTGLLEDAYHQGSRIHTNSWGPKWTKRQLSYNDIARALDDFVWKHQDIVVCFSAGNDGRKSSKKMAHIGAQAAAKNCITVGSCDNE